DEIVLGYVEAASVSQKRIFFNYEDLFSPVTERAYPFNCQDDSSPETHISYCCNNPHCVDSCPTSIIEKVHLNLITLTGENDENIGTCPGPYTYVPIPCGDCTLLGSTVVPEFWIE
ncbi:MAG: DUF4249 domain-containing protein, partial [Flavobacteriaceae bacterium]|nr:DUF4249 domain-containing protein [Flavobacteriaceae bacterium]